MKQFENGRSLIEMLGVLAIIGVLSVGGLSGYTMAMNRHRANQILDYVSRAAVLAQTHGTGSTAVSNEACTKYNGGETAPSSMGSASCKLTTSTSHDRVTVTFTVENESVREALKSRSAEAACVTESGSSVTITTNCIGCNLSSCTVASSSGGGV